jgi:hypothetical protein
MSDKYKRNGSLEDIVRARLTEDWDSLTEASFERVSRHVEHGHFGIITSYRGGINNPQDLTAKEGEPPKDFKARKQSGSEQRGANRRSFKAFRQNVNKAGYGYVRMVGHGDTEGGSTKGFREHSMFISGKHPKASLSLDQMHQWARHPDSKQDSYIYSGPETHDPSTGKNDVRLYFSDTEKPTNFMSLGGFHKGRLGQYHSRLLGREGVTRTWGKGGKKITHRGRHDGGEEGNPKKGFTFEGVEEGEEFFYAWEALPEQSVGVLQAYHLLEKKVALEENITLDLTTESIVTKLRKMNEELD